jgi:hypothetical protein
MQSTHLAFHKLQDRKRVELVNWIFHLMRQLSVPGEKCWPRIHAALGDDRRRA